ncbi:MAG: exodeoxyribonuclease VII large subunit [Candidatus Margulisbacteria bacterium]|nr:exodeoxyribonuclease VII large subunit [Candidatus Margulisiibacteriota bacterium]
MTEKVFTVSEITRYLKNSIEKDAQLQSLWILGEVSNVRSYQFGNQLYFTLKDESAQISCVIFSSYHPSFELKDNMQVIARGKVSVYEKRGVYTFQVYYLEPSGIGALAIAFEQLKQKLGKEGLFNEEYKKAIPLYPRRVAIVTSPTGAALHDVVATIRSRNQSVQIFIIPAVVQGDGAAASIVRGIEIANSYGDLDVLILARGGGSIEELWAFNEEVVARAIFNSKLPVISAIGHEVDFTIADFVADVRAATPTAAAVMVSLSKDEYIQYFTGYKEKIKHILINKLQEKQMFLADLNYDLSSAISLIIQRRKETLLILSTRLKGLDPMISINKGYVLVRKGNKIIKSVKDINPDDSVILSFHDGDISAIIR